MDFTFKGFNLSNKGKQILKDNGYKIFSSDTFNPKKYKFVTIDNDKEFLGCNDNSLPEKDCFLKHIKNENDLLNYLGLSIESPDPSPHYDNKPREYSNLFDLQEQLELNGYEFDILKRIVRMRKKGEFENDLQKIRKTLDLYEESVKKTGE